MLEQRFVYFARRDVFAAFDDQLFQSAGHEIKSVAVAVAEITGRQPSCGIDRLRGFRRRTEIFEHDVRAAHLDLAELAIRVNASIASGDARFDAERSADAADFPLRSIERIRKRNRGALGQAQRFDHRQPEALLERSMLVWRERRRRRTREA